MSQIVLKLKKLCDKVVRNKICVLLFVPDHFWTNEMCNEIMRTMSDAFHCIPDCFQTQKMCDQAVKEDSSFLQFVPDWFVTREWILMWYDDDKTKGSKSLNKKRVNVYCLASIKTLG